MCAHFLHDIDFAAGGPSEALVRGHHPERRPGTLALGELDTGLHIAVFPSLAGVHAGRDDLSVDVER